jgi:hypothetical protein
MQHIVEMASTGIIYIPSFIKTDPNVQVILMFYFNCFRGCSVGIIDGRDL